MVESNYGPYMNEDGDWWVPVEGMSYLDARRNVESCLSYDVPEDGTLRYLGKVMSYVCDEHVGEEIGPCCYRDETGHSCSRYVLCYHFEENSKW